MWFAERRAVRLYRAFQFSTNVMALDPLSLMVLIRKRPSTEDIKLRSPGVHIQAAEGSIRWGLTIVYGLDRLLRRCSLGSLISELLRDLPR